MPGLSAALGAKRGVPTLGHKLQGAKHRGWQQEAQREHCWDSSWLVVTDPATAWLGGSTAPRLSPYSNKPEAFAKLGLFLCWNQAPTPLPCARNAA